MGVRGLFVLSSVLAGVAAAGEPPGPVDGGSDECASGYCKRPIPPELRGDLSDAARIGRLIFEQDEVSARATDMLYARAPSEKGGGRLRGWVTLPGPWWRVVFFVSTGSDVGIGYELDYPADEPPERARPTFRRIDPPRSPDPDERARFTAIQTAISAVNQAKEACGPNVNPVVLPGSILGQKGWLVYLLASTHERGTVVQGGHQRFLVTDDGRAVVSSEQLSRCALQHLPEKTVGLALNTPFYDHPNEGHVFTSLSTRLDFFLGTERGLWKIKGSEILFFEPVSSARQGQ